MRVHGHVCRVTEEQEWNLNAARKLAPQPLFAISWNPRTPFLIRNPYYWDKQGLCLTLCRRKYCDIEITWRTGSQTRRSAPITSWQGVACLGCALKDPAATGEDSSSAAHSPPEHLSLLGHVLGAQANRRIAAWCRSPGLLGRWSYQGRGRDCCTVCQLDCDI